MRKSLGTKEEAKSIRKMAGEQFKESRESFTTTR